MEAPLGDDRLTKADLARLQRAAEAKQPLVQLRGEWVMVDRGGLDRVMARVGSGGETTVGALVRSSLGLGDLDTDSAADREKIEVGEPVSVTASGWLGKLLDDVHSPKGSRLPP